jgi:hypothetical protein
MIESTACCDEWQVRSVADLLAAVECWIIAAACAAFFPGKVSYVADVWGLKGQYMLKSQHAHNGA